MMINAFLYEPLLYHKRLYSISSPLHYVHNRHDNKS